MAVPASPGVDPDLIAQGAARMGVTLRPEHLGALAAFARLFLGWNERINLGGAISAIGLVERHLVDSFAAARFVGEGAAVADVGSGGGLPALPLAVIRPDLRLQLFEPTGKKVAFLRTAIRELDLRARVSVQPERVLATPARPALFDVAMSRATLAPGDWLSLGRTMVRPTGSVLVYATTPTVPSGEEPREKFGYAVDRWLLVYGAAG